VAIKYDRTLIAESQQLWDTCVPKSSAAGVDKRVQKLITGRPRYEPVADAVGCPWQFVAVVHSLEADVRFDRHLHNGDPLTARTVQVPPGRPAKGSPPFTWEASADDALRLEGIHRWRDWSIPGMLFRLESYNGFGYRKKAIHSPYLWSFSNHYVRGKFVADGVWDPDAVSGQIGAAVLLKRLAAFNEFQPHPAPAPEPLPEALRGVRYDSAHRSADAEALQRWLNPRLPQDISVDGIPGRQTADCVLLVTGNPLPGDPLA
jgi:lysozyme family protein